MAAPPAPRKGERWQQVAAAAVVFSFAYLALTAAGEIGQFPHRYAPVATDFDTSFMVLADGDPTPLLPAWGTPRAETVSGVPIQVQNLTFLSEWYENVDIRIAGAIARPVAGGPAPGIVLVHGYGGTHDDMMGIARAFAAAGYAALAIDAPDSGRSTPFPKRTPDSLVNATPDPRGAFFFHVAYAASRALTLLASLPTVDGNSLGVLGASQGGLVTLYLAAKDPRVRAAMPVIPGGNLGEAFAAPSLVDLLLPKGLGAADPRAVAFERHYDPLGYAPLIRVPVLFMAGTNDEFFPLPGVMSTYQAIPPRTPATKWLSLVPNFGHAAYDGWTETVEAFLAHVFLGGPALPDPAIQAVSSDWAGVHVTATAPAGSKVVLVFRESTAADRWRWSPMAASGATFTGTANPMWPGTVSLYAAVMDGDRFVTTSPVVTSPATGYAGPILLVATALLSAYLFGSLGIRYRDRLAPLGAALLSLLGASVSWVGVAGRASWGWYEIADRTSAGSVLLILFLLFFAGLVTLALLRPRAMLLLSWIPVLFSLAVVGLLAVFVGSAVAIGPSWGLVPIVASPLLVLAERRWRKGKEPKVF